MCRNTWKNTHSALGVGGLKNYALIGYIIKGSEKKVFCFPEKTQGTKKVRL